MNFLTLSDIKAQARIDHSYEDSLLTRYGNAAENKILNDTGRTYAELLEFCGGTIPDDLILAGLMLAATWYRHRSPDENVQMYAVPYSYESLIAPYVIHTFPTTSTTTTSETT